MISLDKIEPQTKDVVLALFVEGPKRWNDLPRIGRANAFDGGYLFMTGDAPSGSGPWASLTELGAEVALTMKLDMVKIGRRLAEDFRAGPKILGGDVRRDAMVEAAREARRSFGLPELRVPDPERLIEGEAKS